MPRREHAGVGHGTPGRRRRPTTSVGVRERCSHGRLVQPAARVELVRVAEHAGGCARRAPACSASTRRVARRAAAGDVRDAPARAAAGGSSAPGVASISAAIGLRRDAAQPGRRWRTARAGARARARAARAPARARRRTSSRARPRARAPSASISSRHHARQRRIRSGSAAAARGRRRARRTRSARAPASEPHQRRPHVEVRADPGDQQQRRPFAVRGRRAAAGPPRSTNAPSCSVSRIAISRSMTSGSRRRSRPVFSSIRASR